MAMNGACWIAGEEDAMNPSGQHTGLLIGGLFGALLLIALEIQAFMAAQRFVERMGEPSGLRPPARP